MELDAEIYQTVQTPMQEFQKMNLISFGASWIFGAIEACCLFDMLTHGKSDCSLRLQF